MNNELVTINTENYAAMAKAMGLSANTGETKKTNVLNRLRVWHQPTMGKDVNSKGKEITTEIIEGGCYRLEIVGETSTYYFAKKAKFRPFAQRYMYKRYVQNHKAKEGDKKGVYHKTIMSDNLNIDLKDSAGTFNCGKPAGYVKDFQSLPKEMQELIKSIKRNRCVFGVVEMLSPVQESDGKETDKLTKVPVLWEIDNRDAYKAMGDIFNKFSKMERLPLQHIINLEETEEFSSNTGNKFYIPNMQLDLTNKLDITDEDHKMFGDFMDWIKVHNDKIVASWDEIIANNQGQVSEKDVKLVNDFVDVDA